MNGKCAWYLSPCHHSYHQLPIRGSLEPCPFNGGPRCPFLCPWSLPHYTLWLSPRYHWWLKQPELTYLRLRSISMSDVSPHWAYFSYPPFYGFFKLILGFNSAIYGWNYCLETTIHPKTLRNLIFAHPTILIPQLSLLACMLAIFGIFA